MGEEGEMKERVATGVFVAGLHETPGERGEASRLGSSPRTRRLRQIVYQYAVALALVAFIIGFSILLPTTFFTLGNARTIVSSQAVLMILAIGLTIPLSTGEFDLSIGSM